MYQRSEERINDWDPNLEARPPLMEIIEATKNERVADQHGILQFSETESDEPGRKAFGRDDGWIVRYWISKYEYDLYMIYIFVYASFSYIVDIGDTMYWCSSDSGDMMMCYVIRSYDIRFCSIDSSKLLPKLTFTYREGSLVAVLLFDVNII